MNNKGACILWLSTFRGRKRGIVKSSQSKKRKKKSFYNCILHYSPSTFLKRRDNIYPHVQDLVCLSKKLPTSFSTCVVEKQLLSSTQKLFRFPFHLISFQVQQQLLQHSSSFFSVQLQALIFFERSNNIVSVHGRTESSIQLCYCLHSVTLGREQIEYCLLMTRLRQDLIYEKAKGGPPKSKVPHGTYIHENEAFYFTPLFPARRSKSPKWTSANGHIFNLIIFALFDSFLGFPSKVWWWLSSGFFLPIISI